MKKDAPPLPRKQKIVNDFSITFGTINGSGSATANITILRALFLMGIPVSGKNIFPSNIKGLPTWYKIRINKDGYVARSETNEIVVAVNPTTLENDIESVAPGGVLFHADDIVLPVERNDITVYPMPVSKIAKEADIPAKLKNYIKNMVYVGVLVQMLNIDINKIEEALQHHFHGREKAVNSNLDVIKSAADWAKANLQKQDPFSVEALNENDNRMMVNGNLAGALGSIYGGVQFSAWYPITPATGLPESMNEYLPQLRKDPESGKDTFAVVQAEDELSAIGMSIGAGWAGLRSMTATSGPGLSLMSEYLGLAYFTEIPVVVWDVQRMGPSTGLPTRTSQGDITQAFFNSHGDTQFVMLFPSSMAECFEFGWRALNIAEKLQTPVIVMIDLDMGMNHWMSEAFEYPTEPIDRGKILWEDDLEKILNERNGDWGRYLDIDGDGIAYRTVAGNRHPKSAYFTRGTGHDEYGVYSEDPENWEKNMARLGKKFETACEIVPQVIIEEMENPKFGLISCGSTELAIQEARNILKEKGINTDFMRIRSTPFSQEVFDFITKHDENYIIEMNDQGQLKQLLTIAAPELATKLKKASKNNGMPLSAKNVLDLVNGNED